MQQEQAMAQVVAIDNDLIEVQLLLESSCSSGACGASGAGCQTNAFARLLTQQPKIRLPKSQDGIQIGDKLLLNLPRSALHFSLILGYLLPLVSLLIGAALGQWLSGDLLAFLLALFFVVLTWWLTGRLRLSLSPNIVKVNP
jgi:sigma-E factor negative regulatory protein RseC